MEDGGARREEMRQARFTRLGGAGPIWQQLRRDLLSRIKRGEYAPGDRLPSERGLCDQYGVSMTTARRAFLELAKEGAVIRRTGVGTMVAPSPRRVRLAFVSVTEEGSYWRDVSAATGEMIAGIGECAWRRRASFNTVGVDEHEATEYLRVVAADGVLLRPSGDVREEHLDILEGSGVPYVVLKRRLPGRKINCIVGDHERAARAATTHLLGLGHRRVGFVNAKPWTTLGRERLSGYKSALAVAGAHHEEDLVRGVSHSSTETGYEAVRSLLALEDPPSAIFIAGDPMALGGYEAAWELGLRIPEDVAFVGHGHSAPGASLRPPLTTVGSSFKNFGSLGAGLLLDLIDGKKAAPQEVVVPSSLIVRGSTAENDSSASSGPQAHTSSGRMQPRQGGKLSGKTAVVVAEDTRFGETLAAACRGAGGRTLLAGGAPDTNALEQADVMIYTLDAADVTDQGLGRLQDLGRSSPNGTGGGMAGTALLVITADTESCSRGGVGRASLRAGLRVLIERWKESGQTGARINALVVVADDRAAGYASTPKGITGAVTFLISNEAIGIDGEVLFVGDGDARAGSLIQ